MQGPLRFPNDERRRGGLSVVQQGRHHLRDKEGGRKLGRRQAGRSHRHFSARLRRTEQSRQEPDEVVYEVSDFILNIYSSERK